MEQLICSNLSVGYDGTIVKDNINFTIQDGDYICILGENGAGKSTLMKTILGLIPPISGSISFGQNLKSTDIGYLPQQTQIQKDFPASVWEVVLSGFINKHGLRFFYTKEEKQTAVKMLEKIGIDHLKKKSYSRLSGGQQQRVLLCRALCATTKIILLDEPTAGLDVQSTAELYALIKKLNDEGLTIIMISHDVENAVSYATKVLTIDDSTKLFNIDEYMKKGEKAC